MDPFGNTQKSWYYVDSWQWLAPTWGGGSPQWVMASAKGPVYITPWDADFETQWAAGDLKIKKAKYLVRRFRWNGVQWTREV